MSVLNQVLHIQTAAGLLEIGSISLIVSYDLIPIGLKAFVWKIMTITSLKIH